MATTLLDANAVLRYLLEDIPEQADPVEACVLTFDKALQRLLEKVSGE